MKPAERILNNQSEFLKFVKSRFALYHNSNVFFRDLHYAVLAYLGERGVHLRYSGGEAVTRDVIAGLVQRGILKQIDGQSWLLLYPDFALPRLQKTA